MGTISYDNTFGMADLAVYARLMADDNQEQMGRLKRNLTQALRQDITQRQREYMILYYGHNMSQPAPAGGELKTRGFCGMIPRMAPRGQIWG